MQISSPAKIALVPFGKSRGDFRLSALPGDAESIDVQLRDIAGVIQSHTGEVGFPIEQNRSLHKNIVGFLMSISTLASLRRDGGDESHEFQALAGKALECRDYLEEKCRSVDATMPSTWGDGIAVPQKPASIFDMIRPARRRKRRARYQKSLAMLATTVEEHISHFHSLCTKELPRDAHNRALTAENRIREAAERLRRQEAEQKRLIEVIEARSRQAELERQRAIEVELQTQLELARRGVPLALARIGTAPAAGDKITPLLPNYQFVASAADALQFRTRLKNIMEVASSYEPKLHFDSPDDAALHQIVADFCAFGVKVANLKYDPARHTPEAALLARSAREHLDYLESKCLQHNLNPPSDWKGGVMPQSARLLQGGCLDAGALTEIPIVVFEVTGHLQHLCEVEIPRLVQERKNLTVRASEIAVQNHDIAPASVISEFETTNRAGEIDRLASASPIRCFYQPNREVRVSSATERAPLREGALGGELPDFTAKIAGNGRLAPGDAIVYRIALDVETIWDADFATIIAASVDAGDAGAISEAFLGLGDENGLAYERSRKQHGLVHLWGGWRLRKKPAAPYLQIKLIMGETPVPFEARITRLFAGLSYDPYRFNPRYEAVAVRQGRPEFAGSAPVLEEFACKARLACRTGTYFAAQSFVKPFLVMREGQPRYPMLIGTVNSLYWYVEQPRHTIEEYKEWGCIAEGDVTSDCGAHAGQMAAYFALVAGPRGRLIAFDPFAQNCLQVEAQGALNAPGRLRTIKAGVGAKRETMRVSILSQMTSTPLADAPDDFTEIEIVPLDDFISEQPTFIKLDIEGAEIDALIGAQTLLRTCRPKIFIEVHTAFFAQFGYTLADLFANIPADIYDVTCKVEGVDHSWRAYFPGLEAGVTQPMMVIAMPKAI